MTLTQLLDAIDAGYAGGRSGLDDGMLDLLLELGNRTGEIRAALAALQGLLAMPDFDGTQATSIVRRDAKCAARAVLGA